MTVKVKMNSKGSRNILNASGVQKELLRRAKRMKASADGMGKGVYEADIQPGKNRVHAMVKTTDLISIKSNAKNNALLKSLDAGK